MVNKYMNNFIQNYEIILKNLKNLDINTEILNQIKSKNNQNKNGKEKKRRRS